MLKDTEIPLIRNKKVSTQSLKHTTYRIYVVEKGGEMFGDYIINYIANYIVT